MSNLRRDARCLIRQREPIRYWQLCFPTRFNELHKGARHASRRSFRFLSKPVAPVFCEHLDCIKASTISPVTEMSWTWGFNDCGGAISTLTECHHDSCATRPRKLLVAAGVAKS